MIKTYLTVLVFISFSLLAQGQASCLNKSGAPSNNDNDSSTQSSTAIIATEQGVQIPKKTKKNLRQETANAKPNKGIEPFFSFAATVASNVSGGLEKNSKYSGQLYTGFKFDLEKLWGLKGTRAKVSMINRHGSGLSTAVGSVFEPLNLVGGQATFLYDLSLEKDIGKKLSLKAGRTTTSDDFSASPFYYYSISNTVNGVIRALLLDGLMTTFPFATWGSRLKYTPSSNHRFQLAAYQLGKRVFDTSNHGMDFAFRTSDNLSMFFQYDWFGKISDRDARVYLGTHQAFGSFTNLDSKTKSTQFKRYYGHFDLEPLKGVNTFLTLAYTTHGQIAKVPFQSSVGVNWIGFAKKRKEDRILFFATFGSFSEEWASSQKQDLSAEMVIELGYRFQLHKRFVIQPSVQYNVRPGGSGLIDNAVIPGIWFETNF